jgi:hypothetical protein
MEKPTRDELIADYTTKAIRKFAQLDLHLHVEDDDMMHADDDGDCLMCGVSYDFGNFDGVRVRFPAGTPPADVTRALRKLLAWAEDMERHPDQDEWVLSEAPEPPDELDVYHRVEVAPDILESARKIAKTRRERVRAVRTYSPFVNPPKRPDE